MHTIATLHKMCGVKSPSRHGDIILFIEITNKFQLSVNRFLFQKFNNWECIELIEELIPSAIKAGQIKM